MESKQFLILEASAGSGKTYSLALRYVYLLLEGGKVGEILALTFTNKAVDEMRQRIGEFLLLLGQEPSSEERSKERDTLLHSLWSEYGWEREKILAIAPSLLRAYWAQKPRIMTIDAFFNAILKKFCWYAGVSHRFEMGEVENEEVEEKFLSFLNQDQKKHLLEICLKHKKSFDSILESVRNMGDNLIDCLVSEECDARTSDQLHAEIIELAKTIQKLVLAHPKSSQGAKDAVAFKNLFELLEKGKTWISKGRTYRPFSKLDLSEDLFDSLRAKLVEFFSAREREFVVFMSKICFLYQKAKGICAKQHNLLSFADVTHKVFTLLCLDAISRDFFYFRLDDRISHILLDEFQDTSVVQYKILRPLIEEILSGDGRIGNRSFFVVGDKKQSIYQFRGGYGQLLEVVKNLSQMKAEILEVNYRSRALIVEFINQVFSQAIPFYSAQKPHKQGGYIKIHPVIDLSQEDGKDQVFQLVLRQIETFVNQGTALEEIAVLVFKNSDVAELGDFLKKTYLVSTKESIALSSKHDAQILIYALKYALSGSSLDKARLAKLLGKGLDDDIECPRFHNETIGSYVYRAIQFFQLNSKVAKQVFEIACMSENCEDFLTRVQECKGAKEEEEGIKILTIHASKGLEFKHLIVLDRLSGSSNRSDFFFCQYDSMTLEGHIFLKDFRRKETDQAFQTTLQIEEDHQEEERKNLLYVALTRACDSLVIVPVSKTRFKSEFECIGIVAGDDVLYPQEQGEFSQRESQSIIPQQEIQVKQIGFGRQEDFIQKETMSLGDYTAMKYGEIFHKALELYLGYGFSVEDLKSALYHHYGYSLDQQKLESSFSQLAHIKSLLIENFDFTQIKSEVSFIQDLKLFRIDCLLLCEDEEHHLKRVVVLDYKSGIQREEDHQQVRHYVNFVKTQYGQVEVLGYLLYLKKLELVCVE